MSAGEVEPLFPEISLDDTFTAEEVTPADLRRVCLATLQRIEAFKSSMQENIDLNRLEGAEEPYKRCYEDLGKLSETRYDDVLWAVCSLREETAALLRVVFRGSWIAPRCGTCTGQYPEGPLTGRICGNPGLWKWAEKAPQGPPGPAQRLEIVWLTADACSSAISTRTRPDFKFYFPTFSDTPLLRPHPPPQARPVDGLRTQVPSREPGTTLLDGETAT